MFVVLDRTLPFVLLPRMPVVVPLASWLVLVALARDLILFSWMDVFVFRNRILDSERPIDIVVGFMTCSTLPLVLLAMILVFRFDIRTLPLLLLPRRLPLVLFSSELPFSLLNRWLRLFWLLT